MNFRSGCENLSRLENIETLYLRGNRSNKSVILCLSSLISLKNLSLQGNNLGDPFPARGIYGATTVGKLTSGDSFCTQESPRAKSGWGRYDQLKSGIIPVGSNLRSFTEKGITFSTGGILIQGCLASVFMLHVHIMHALYSCKPFRVPNFAFREEFHASGVLSPRFGAVLPLILLLKSHWHVFISFPCHCIAYAIASVLQAFSADRQCKVPAGNLFLPTAPILCRWTHASAGDDPIQPVVLPSAQGCNPEVLTASRGGKEEKQRQPMHGGALPEAYEATTIGNLTSGASFFTQESPKSKSGRRRYGSPTWSKSSSFAALQGNQQLSGALRNSPKTIANRGKPGHRFGLFDDFIGLALHSARLDTEREALEDGEKFLRGGRFPSLIPRDRTDLDLCLDPDVPRIM
ncbi:hypothetical protein HYC85_027689 [Camellia sinensis]|uniref:Uncharacterized protein n=1 Tax=Camellia sinensis TaxID=4442 RepID=A0A7J7FV22_CAMSI|nr:hypothetical protein HYC85_027689 [Camellia sinensis]